MTQEGYLKELSELLLSSSSINHGKLLNSIINHQQDDSKHNSNPSHIRSSLDSSIVSPIKIYKMLLSEPSLDANKLILILEAFLDALNIEKPVNHEIRFLTLLKVCLLL